MCVSVRACVCKKVVCVCDLETVCVSMYGCQGVCVCIFMHVWVCYSDCESMCEDVCVFLYVCVSVCVHTDSHNDRNSLSVNIYNNINIIIIVQ